MLDPQKNQAYGEDYQSQVLHHDLPISAYTLRRNMTHRMHARRFKKAKIKAISKKNKTARVQFGEVLKYESIGSY